jgi:spore germination protein KC
VKKFEKFLKTVPMKLYIIFSAIFVFTFFSNDFGLVDIQKTAIILAAGIDRTDEGFHLTAQIAVPKGSDRNSCGTASINIEGDGKTVSDCVTQIYSKTGWVPKLIFCNLILIGEETAKEDVFDGLDFFLRNEYMQDSCTVAVCEGTAKDMLTSTSALDDTSSQSIEKIFSDATQKSGTNVKNTLKDFSIGYYGRSKSSYMPFVRAFEQDCGADSGGGEGSSASGSGGGSQSASDNKGETQKKIYFANETALFSEGRMVALLGPEETFAYSLLQGKVFAGTMTAEEDGQPVTLSILSNEGKISLNTKNKPKVILSIKTKLRLYNRGVPAPIDDVSKGEISEKVKESAQERLTQYCNRLWEICKSSGCDLFQLNRDLYRTSPKKYAEWKDTILSVADLEIKLKIEKIN